MLCSEFQLVKSVGDIEDIKPLPCNRWSCEYCAPRRRRQLCELATAGHPNKLLTITVNAAIGENPNHRRAILHDAWKRLVKQLIRQFALPPSARWRLTGKPREPKMTRRIERAAALTPAGSVTEIHYMAFLERTKKGEPHLHILLRCPFVPQDWIAERMAALAHSPICWIEAVKGTRAAVNYVTKYITKAPAQFGTAKRYYVSRRWRIDPKPESSGFVFDRRTMHIQRVRWAEELQHRVNARYTWAVIDDGWVRFWKPGVNDGAAGDITKQWQQGGAEDA